MKFAREEYSIDLIAQMIPLWREHWLEIATFKDILLDPDLEAYEKVAMSGALRIYTVRTDDDELIGYEVMFVRKNPHYMQSLQANSDILFLKKDYRHGLVGRKFIDWADMELKKEGVAVVYQHVKEAFDFSPMLKRMGYQSHDRVLARRLY